MRAVVVIAALLLQTLPATAQQPDGMRRDSLMNTFMLPEPSVKIREVDSMTRLLTDTLFGRSPLVRRLMTRGDGPADTAFCYSFNRRNTEAVVFNILDPDRDSATAIFSGYFLRQFYQDNFIHFVTGADSSFTQYCYQQWLQTLARVQVNRNRRMIAKPNKATFSKSSLAEDTQFEIFMNADDDGQWLEPESVQTPKRKKRR